MKIKNCHVQILLLLLVSCASSNKLTVNKYMIFGNKKFNINIPNMSYSEELILIGSSEKEYRYIYKDSATLFCTNNQSGSDLIYRFLKSKDYINFLDKDTLFLSLSEDEKYYCIRKVEGIFVGYSEVHKDDKQIFDHAINTLKKK